MGLISTLVVGAVCVAIGLFLAFLPMRLLLYAMAKKVAAPIKAFIQRQRERRTSGRDTPDRRNTPV
jgi:hypothetical protein